MSQDDDELTDLPEDPELQFVVFERRLRADMWASLRNSQDWSYDRDQKIYYVSKLMALHDAHQLSILQRPTMLRRSDDFDTIFDEFIDEVTYWTTQIEVRHTSRQRRVATIVALDSEVRRLIHSYINEIRQTLQPINLTAEKKEALFTKLNALADEVDRDRTKTEAWTSFVLEIASTGGKAAEELKPVRRLADSIANLFGKAKELSERLGLSSPSARKRLEPPRKQLTHRPEDRDCSAAEDDEIPF